METQSKIRVNSTIEEFKVIISHSIVKVRFRTVRRRELIKDPKAMRARKSILEACMRIFQIMVLDRIL